MLCPSETAFIFHLPILASEPSEQLPNPHCMQACTAEYTVQASEIHLDLAHGGEAGRHLSLGENVLGHVQGQPDFQSVSYLFALFWCQYSYFPPSTTPPVQWSLLGTTGRVSWETMLLSAYMHNVWENQTATRWGFGVLHHFLLFHHSTSQNVCKLLSSISSNPALIVMHEPISEHSDAFWSVDSHKDRFCTLFFFPCGHLFIEWPPRGNEKICIFCSFEGLVNQFFIRAIGAPWKTVTFGFHF